VGKDVKMAELSLVTIPIVTVSAQLIWTDFKDIQVLTVKTQETVLQPVLVPTSWSVKMEEHHKVISPTVNVSVSMDITVTIVREPQPVQLDPMVSLV